MPVDQEPKTIDCISVATMRESDEKTIAGGVPGVTLMYRAALGVYRAVRSDLTVTIGFVKTGLVSENAGRYMKRLVWTDIGIKLCRKEQRILADGGVCPPEGVLPCPAWLDPAPIDVHGEAYPENQQK